MASPITTAPGDVTVRFARPEDAEFAGGMMVEAFHGKMAWAVGESRFPQLKEYLSAVHRDPALHLHRILIAEYRGEPAGLVEIVFRNDPKQSYSVRGSSYLGCWANFRLTCLDGVMEGSEKIPEKVCVIEIICVDEKFRGLGIGKELLDRTEEEARGMGCERMMLSVIKHNRAINLYERQGYMVEEMEDGCCITWCAFGVRYFYNMVKVL